MDHCNGLLLLDFERVVNPATRQWVRLPPPPSPVTVTEEEEGHCLVYDPVVSPHYEVVLIHLLPRLLLAADSEWPPSPYTTHVFSSRSWRWEERSFVRQGVPAGTIADKLPGSRLYIRTPLRLSAGETLRPLPKPYCHEVSIRSAAIFNLIYYSPPLPLNIINLHIYYLFIFILLLITYIY